MTSSIEGTHRFGVVVPPENPTVEAEFPRLLAGTSTAVVTRLPVVVGTLEERLLAYNSDLAARARSFGGMRLDAIYLACTGSSYLVGPSGDSDLATALGSAGARPVTAARAIIETLRELGRSRVLVVSPYPEWLTERAVAYWQDSGLVVDGVHAVPAPNGIYAITSGHVTDLLRRLDLGTADAVLLSGTGMPTIDAIDQVATELQIPVLSSSLAAAYQLGRCVGAVDGPAAALVSPWR